MRADVPPDPFFMKAWQTKLSEIYALRRPSADAGVDGTSPLPGSASATQANQTAPSSPAPPPAPVPPPPAALRPTVRLLGRRASRLITLLATPDGQTLVAAHDDGCIKLQRVATGQLLHEWSVQAEPHALALSPDGRWLAIGLPAPAQHGPAVDIRLYDLRHGVSAHTITVPCHGALPPGGWRVDALQFHPREPVLAVACGSSLGLWDVWSGHARHMLRGHTGTVTALSFHPQGIWLASGDDAGSVHVWPFTGSTPAHSLHQQGPIQSMAASGDGHWLAWGTADGSVLVSGWAPVPLERVRLLEGQGDTVAGLGFTTEALVIAKRAADGAGNLRLWNTAQGQLAGTWPLPGVAPTCLALGTNGRWAAAGGDDGHAAMIALHTGEVLRQMPGDGPAITTLVLSPDQQWLVSGDATGRVAMWDPRTGKSLRDMRVHRQAVVDAGFSPDGRWWASAAADGTVLLWGRGKPHPLHMRAGLRRLAFCPQSQWLALAGDDGALQLLPLREPLPKQTPVAHQAGAPIVELCFSTHGQLLAWACADGQVTCWDPASRQVRSSHRLPLSNVRTLALSPDLRWLAAATHDGQLLLWDLVTDRAAWQLRPQLARITHLMFDDDAEVLHASGPGGAQVDWSVASGQLLCSRVGHAERTTHDCLGLAYPRHELHGDAMDGGAIQVLVQ